MNDSASDISTEKPANFAINGLHLAVLAAFAFAQPLYDILGKNAQFFLVRQMTVSDLVLFVVTLSVLVPLLFFFAAIIAGRIGPRVGRGVCIVLAAVLLALIALPVLNKIENLLGVAKLILAGLIGPSLAYVVYRFRVARTFLSFLSPAMLVFPFVFWTSSAAYPIASARAGSLEVAPQISATAPVVVVIFDEFPLLSLLDGNRKIDRVRYPNFAALADNAYWFRDATTIESITASAVPAILTGRYSKSEGLGVALYSEAPENLFTLLSRQYQLRIFEVATRLAPPTRDDTATRELNQNFRERFSELLGDAALVYANLILPQSVLSRFPELSAGMMEIFIRADADVGPRGQAGVGNPLGLLLRNLQSAPAETLAEMEAAGIADWRLFQYHQFLQAIDARPQTFYFVHSLFPHIPYRFSDTGNYYSNDITLAGWDPGEDRWHDSEAPVHLAYQRHLMQVGFTDRLLGQLVATLKAKGIYDDALLVVTADHGISFRPGRSRREPDANNHYEIAHVPLFIKLPGQRAGVLDDRTVQTIDIVPSVATALGIALPWPVDGQSLFAADSQTRGRIAASTAYAQPATRRIGGVEFDQTFAGIGDALQRQVDLFGQGADRYDPDGPHPALIGRSVASLPVETETGKDCRFRLKDEKNFANVRPGSGRVPTYVTGGLGCFPELKTVAVAVNGVIRASAAVFPGYGNQLSMAAMIPEDAFRAGRNSIEVYLVDARPDGSYKLRHVVRPGDS